jgi:hypothetical protein
MLPAVHTYHERDAVIGDETIIRAAVADLAAWHGLAGREVRRYPEGSVPVYAIGDQHVIKLHPPAVAKAAITEAHVLEFLQGKLPVASRFRCPASRTALLHTEIMREHLVVAPGRWTLSGVFERPGCAAGIPRSPRATTSASGTGTPSHSTARYPRMNCLT